LNLKKQVYTKYIQINENCKRKNVMGDKSRIEYETDAIKDQNSTLELKTGT
jgi:hypothetical protein